MNPPATILGSDVIAPLQWEQVSHDGMRADESLDEWLIARNRVMGVTAYTLWHNHERIGKYDSADDAMGAAEAIRSKS